jgi:integrase
VASRFKAYVPIPPEARAAYGGKTRLQVYGSTKAELSENVFRAKTEVRSRVVRSRDDSMARWVEEWLDVQVGPVKGERIRAFTAIRIHHFDALGDMDVKAVRQVDLQRELNRLAAKNPMTGRPTAKATLLKVRAAAVAFFDYLIVNRVVPFNPAVGLGVDRNAPVLKRSALPGDLVGLACSIEHPMRPAVMLGAYAGLRRGEVVALGWEDIDLDERVIRVRRAAKLAEGRNVGATKTVSGVRDVYILEPLLDYLVSVRRESGLLLRTGKGLAYSGNDWDRGWKSFLRELNKANAGGGIEAIGFTHHWLRHTYASMIYAMGVDPKAMANQLGHKEPDISLVTYTDVTTEFAIGAVRSAEQKKGW